MPAFPPLGWWWDVHVELCSNGLGESRLKHAKLVHEGLQVGGIFVSLSDRFLGKRTAPQMMAIFLAANDMRRTRCSLPKSNILLDGRNSTPVDMINLNIPLFARFSNTSQVVVWNF